MKTYYATKQTMTQTWTKNGSRLPVTILEVKPMVVTQVKTKDIDGYSAIQIGIGTKKEKNLSQSILGHLKKSNIIPRFLKEIRLSEESTQNIGDSISIADEIQVGDIINVIGNSKGRGFSGPMKRWGFKGGPKTHGQSDRWRAPGSIGQGTTPGRVLKGRHMAGQYGGETYNIKNLQVIKVVKESSQIWVSGPVPGSKGSLIELEVIKNGKFEGLRDEAPVAPDAIPVETK